MVLNNRVDLNNRVGGKNHTMKVIENKKNVTKVQKYVFFDKNLQNSQKFSPKINNLVYTIIQDHRVLCTISHHLIFENPTIFNKFSI